MEAGVASTGSSRSTAPASQPAVKTYGIADPDAPSGSDDDYDSQDF
jgi:hypothetical protein